MTTGTKKLAVTSPSAYRSAVSQGTAWEAPSGQVFLVRDLNLFDRLVMNQLPSHLQQVVASLIDDVEALRDNDSEEDAAEEFMELMGNREGKMSLAVGNAYELAGWACCLGIIEPQIVMTPNLITDPDRQLAASDLTEEDRMAFFRRAFGGDTGEAQAVATFPERTNGPRRRART